MQRAAGKIQSGSLALAVGLVVLLVRAATKPRSKGVRVGRLALAG